MPFIGEQTTFDTPVTGGAPSLNDYTQSADAVVKQPRGTIVGTAGLLGFGAVDLADTVASSIPGLSRGLGIERGDIDKAALNAVDLPGLNDFYNDYKSGIETTSGIMGIVGTELIARRLGAPTGAFMSTVSKIPYVRRLATLDTEYANAMQTVRNVDAALASRGAIGAEQYVGRVVVDRTLASGATVTGEVGRRGAFWSARVLGAATQVRNAAGREAIMSVGLNQNGFLYDDSMSHNLTWMGLGLAIPAAVEGLASVYQMRKFVNSDQIRRRFADALDPDEVERGRILWHGKPVTQGTLGGPGTFFGGTHTDGVTSLLVNASTLKVNPLVGSADEARQLMANRSALATEHMQLARETIQKVTTKGISTNGFTRFSMDSRGFGNHVDMMMHRDPSSMYGVEQLGGIADDMTVHGVHQAHVARLDERIEEVEKQISELTQAQADSGAGDGLQVLRRRLDAESKLTPMVAIDGEWMPLSEGSAIEGFTEPKDIKFTADAKHGLKKLLPKVKGATTDMRGLWEAITENPAGNVSIDSDLVWHLPGTKTLDSADHFDILRLYRTANRAITQLAKFEGPITLPKKPDWFQLDAAEEILQRSNGTANVVFPAGMTRDSAQIESMIQKSKAIKINDAKEIKAGAKAESKGLTYEGQLSKLRTRYNLPKLTAYERGVLGESEHPVEGLVRGMAHYSEDEIRAMSLTDIKEATARYKRLGDVAPVSANDVKSLRGNSFTYMLDESGQPVKPLIAYSRPFQVAEWSQEHVAERLAASNMQRISIASAANAAPMTRQIVGSIVNSPDLPMASATHELMDIQVQGSLTGSSTQSPFGSLGKALITSEHRDRDAPIMLAASRVKEDVSRQTRDYTRAIMEGAFGDVLGRLESPRNASSLLLVDQFATHAQGWELAAKPVARQNGFHGFTLADTAENRARFKQAFDREMPKGQTLLAPNGKEVVLDQLGMEAQQRMNAATDALFQEKNTILRAQGRPEIQKRNWYVPAPKTEGKIIGFTIGPDGKTVPNMSVVASTQEAFNKGREAVLKKLNDMGMGYTFQTQDQIENFASIWDRAQMDFIDPGTTAVQPGKRSRGVLTGQEVKVNAFAEARQNIHSQFLNHGDDLIELLMRDSINGAKARSAIAGSATRNRAGFFREQQYNSIYDMYLENLLGRSKLNGKGTFFGGGFNWVEGKVDAFLEGATPGASKVFQAADQFVRKWTPWNSNVLAKRDFDTLTQKLGPYMPFESATQMLEAKGAGALPPTLAKITGGINRFSAAMLLRFMEVAHPIVNLTGIVNAMPAVIRSMTPKTGQSVEDFAATIGHNASIFQLKDGTPIGILDMNKIGARAFKRAWDRSSHADYDYMVRRGFLSQEVAEFHRQFGAIESKGTLETFFVGDPNKTGFARKGVVGWGSILSDRSEDFSRSWGHMIGLELADHLGIAEKEAKHAFAHDIANKMIANYSPQNRPEIFQGAIGAPIGLFQSFVQNYYQRLFRYVETKDFAALGHQYAAQGALFGVTSLPGWKEFNGLLIQSDGSGDPTSALYHRFPGPVGSLLGHGVVSNIPRLFGQDGVDLYSRGDVNIRLPGLGGGEKVHVPILGDVSLPSVPGASVLAKLWQGMNEGIHAFEESLSSQGKLPSVTQLAEIASNMIANRPIAGMLEQFLAHGNDTDRYGQLVNDTRSGMETAYRLIGLRSMRQSQQVQAFYANKTAMEHKAANDEILKLATRSAIRAGNLEADLPGIMQSYMDNGGDPRNFRRWIKQTYQSATTTRARIQLEKAIKNPAKVDQALRLLDAGVGVSDDEATPDPAQTWQTGQGDDLSQDTHGLGNYEGQMTVDNSEVDPLKIP